MTTASRIFRPRRILALCVATVLLHYAALNWVGSRIGAASTRADSAPPAIVASLRAPPPAPVPLAAPAAAAPATPPPPPKRAPAPAAPRAPAFDPAPDPGAAAVPATVPAAEAGAPVAPAQVQSVPAPEEAAPEPPAAPVPAGDPVYRVSLPPSATLAMDVTRTDAKGVNWSGQSLMRWQRDGEGYRMSVVASVTVLVTINLVELASEGALGPRGIVPRTMTEKRRGRAQTATHFDAQQGQITFSASEARVAMAPGAQDRATFPMQLAAIARADAAQLGAGIALQVGDDRDASVYHFALVGEEALATPLGRIVTWHLTRAPLPGSYNSRLDVWLAPAHHWFPVQLRSTEANGAVTTQTVRQIDLKETGN